MIYLVSFKLVNGEGKNIKMNCLAEIIKSNYSRYDYSRYDNGRYLIFKSISEIDDKMVFDIRYDKAYNQDDEMSYIDSFIERSWNGKNGSYKAECIHVKKIIS